MKSESRAVNPDRMDAVDLIRRLHDHRMWATEQLCVQVKSLTEDQLRQRVPIGQGSVWKTLTHLMAAEYVWLEALIGNESPTMPGDLPNELPGNQQGESPIESLGELLQKWRELDHRWRIYLDALTEESIGDTIFKISTSSGAGKRLGISRSDVLLHICTHAQYTTAQLINMLRQLGCTDLPDVMLVTMARQSPIVLN